MSEWIKVNDKLPGELEYVLCWASGDDVHFIPKVMYLNCHMDWNENYKVTHWMPLPEPPED